MLILTNVSTSAKSRIWCSEENFSGGIVITQQLLAKAHDSGQQGTLIIVSDQSNPQISATIQGALNRRV